ncbi:MAG TPA: hypothetical protein VFW14_16180 [Gaiellales bacterium]|nr:hypothetical protein [Gaiellales bacterium]
MIGLLVAGCGGSGPQSGSAFVPPGDVMVRESIPEPVGEQDGLLLADLTNASGSPVRVTGVQLVGTGLGQAALQRRAALSRPHRAAAELAIERRSAAATRT